MQKMLNNLNYEKCLDSLKNVNPEVFKQLVGLAGLYMFYRLINGKGELIE